MSFFRKPTPLPVTQGGTGNVYNTYGYAIIGNGYSAYLELTPSTSGNVMTSNGTTWTSAPPSGGGSGTVNSGTAYQLAYYAASGTAVSTLGSLGTNGQVLTSGGAGVAPTWTTISGGASQATATALGTVYAKQTTGGGTPYLTAFGYNAGVSTTGDGNSAFGTQALYTNSTGTLNTAVGYQSLYVSNGSNNTAIGEGSLTANTSGSDNVSVGLRSLYTNTTGGFNTACGRDALRLNLTSSNNTAVGYGAAYSTTASANTAVGYQALNSNTTGASNIAVGYQAGYSNLTSGDNVYLGYRAGYSATSAFNTILGNYAGYGATGNNNSIVGYNAFNAITSGRGNTGLGYSAGSTITSGEYNVYVGFQSTASGVAASYEVVIAAGPSGYTGKGTSTAFINGGGGGSYNGANSTLWAVTSDQRLKKNIVDNNIGLDKISSIQVRNFEYRVEEEITELPKHCAINKTGLQLGVIAQELQTVLPECVKTESTGVMSVDADNLTWYMINAIKELNAEITALKAKVGV